MVTSITGKLVFDLFFGHIVMPQIEFNTALIISSEKMKAHRKILNEIFDANII